MKGSTSKYVQKNGRPSWRYHWRPGKDANGQWIRLTKAGFKTQREAETELAKAKDEYAAKQKAASETPTRPDMTFAMFFETWVRDFVRRHCAPKTSERYEQLGQYAIREFGNVPLTKLTALMLEQAFNRLLDRGGVNGRPLQSKTVRDVAFVVHGALKKAVAWDMLTVNVADFRNKITLPKWKKKEAVIVEKPAFARFLEIAKPTRLYPLVVLAAATGARRGELLALEWRDLDPETGKLTVSKSLEEIGPNLRVKSTKSGKPRSFVVPRWALEVLQRAPRTTEPR